MSPLMPRRCIKKLPFVSWIICLYCLYCLCAGVFAAPFTPQSKTISEEFVSILPTPPSDLSPTDSPFTSPNPIGTREQTSSGFSECIDLDYLCKKELYTRQLEDHLNFIKNNVQFSGGEQKTQIEPIKLKIQRITALTNLIAGLQEIFNNIIDSNEPNTTIIHSNFEGETLKIITDFQNFVYAAESLDLEQVLKKHSTHAKNKSQDPGKATEHSMKEHSGNGKYHKENLGLVDNVLQEVRDSADRLEEKMEHRHNYADNSRMHGSFETVMKLEEDDENEPKSEAENQNNHSSHEEGIHTNHGHPKVIALVDQDNNEYVLARPKDLTLFYEDSRLLSDLILVIVVAFVCGWLFNTLGLPAFLGYIIAGCILGPEGFNSIQELIQAETISQLGVIFIVFMLGLEFSIEKLRVIWRFALGSAALIFVGSLGFFVFIGYIVDANVNEAVLVGACVSLSSTAVVERLRSQELEPLYGLLIIQDVLFGLLLAVMSAFSKSGLEMILAIGKIGSSLIAFCIFSFLIARIPAALFLKRVKGTNHHELFLLGSISLCLVMSQISFYLDLGVEIGCFVAGVLIHSRKSIFESSISLVEPVKDVFSCLFFASIGLHIYPSFLLNEGLLLFALTAGVIVFKYLTTGVALIACENFEIRRVSAMAIGLAQISEFTFVLASRAKAAGIISREVYYLLLTTTSLTLMVTPVLWNILFFRGTGENGLLTKDTDYNASTNGQKFE